MPCYESNEVSVVIETADRELLKAALAKLRHKYVETADGRILVKTKNGEISIGRGEATLPQAAVGELNKIRCGYADESVYARAEQLGYSVIEEPGEKQGEINYTLRRYD